MREICRIASKKRRKQLLAMPLEKRRRVLHRNGRLRPARALRLYETADYSAVLASIHRTPLRTSAGDVIRGIAAWIKRHQATITAAARQLAMLISPRSVFSIAGAGLLLWLSSQPNPVGAARALWASEWDYALHDATMVLYGTAKSIRAKPAPYFVPVAATKDAARAGNFHLNGLNPGRDYKIIQDLGDVLLIESHGHTGWVMGRYVDRR